MPAEQRSAVVDEMAGAFTAQRQPIVAAIEVHRTFVEAAAELYELMASQPESIKAMRHGLEISDPRMLERYDSRSTP